MPIQLNDTFTKELPADSNLNNSTRQVTKACFSFVTPKIPKKPQVIHTAEETAKLLGFDKTFLQSEAFKNIFSGAQTIENSQPFAMCYGGHQFGNWAGQLGDGRAINLGEITHNGERQMLQLKGAGPTPYSRSADGLAVLRSSVREHLCSEAMFHLCVPTTRSLSLMLSGDEVWRDMLYDGNAAFEKGAIVCRVAPSFIRFGNFQIFAARNDVKTLTELTDYTIDHFFPEIKSGTKEGYIQFFKAVSERTLDMIMHWQRVGFVHGVMNTDNMSILGLTIDYGPYGWLEGFDPNWTPNTTDRSHQRYRFGHQPQIGLWNLYQLANALYLLVDDPKPFESILENYKRQYIKDFRTMNKSKLGLKVEGPKDDQLIESMYNVLLLTEIDFTLFFRELSNISKADDSVTALKKIASAFYFPTALIETVKEQWEEWMIIYLKRLQLEPSDDVSRKAEMKKVNPKYVFRNYMAQLAIDKAETGDYSLIETFYKLLRNPYDEQPEHEEWYAKRPEWARHKAGCSMLSCSS